MWVNLRFQPRLHNLLCDSIRHSRNSKTSFSATLFRYFHCPDWRWKVAARRHPIPDLVKILLQSLFKILDRLSIDACRSLVRLHSLVRFPDLLLRNTKWLCLIHRAPPIAGWLVESGSSTQRLGSIPLWETSSLIRAVPSLPSRIRTLALVGSPLVASPLAS
jgi:hypothetical protein